MTDYSVADFNRDFPDDGRCLEYVVGLLYPAGMNCRSCGVPRKHHRLSARRAYSCDYCGTHVYPLAGSVFGKSSTSLKCWFYAMYLIVSTLGEITDKELQRELGVTLKTASRISRQIAALMPAPAALQPAALV